MNQIKTKIEETAAIASRERGRERDSERGRETEREGNNKTKIEN